MTAPDPDAVQVLAQVMHRVRCLPGANPAHRYSKAHQDQDERWALLFMVGFADAGYALSPTDS